MTRLALALGAMLQGSDPPGQPSSTPAPAAILGAADPARAICLLRPSGTRGLVLQGLGADLRADSPLAHLAGPGVLQSIVFVDGSTTPLAERVRLIVDGEPTELPRGSSARVGRVARVAFAFVPRAFQRALRVELRGPAPEAYRIGLAMPGTAAEAAGLERLLEADGFAALRGAEPAVYLVDLPARTSATYLLPPGPRMIRGLELQPTPGTEEAWSRARLRLAWETDDVEADSAGVDVPLGPALGRLGGDLIDSALAGRARDESSRGASSWFNLLPMPYRTQAILRIDTERPLAGRFRVATRAGVEPNAGYLRAASIGPARGGTGASDTGRGHVVGLASLGVPDDSSIPELILDGQSLGRLDSALALPRLGADTDARATPLLGATRGGSHRWLLVDPPTFDRALTVAVPRHDSKSNTEASWVLWWYSDQPGTTRPGDRVPSIRDP